MATPAGLTYRDLQRFPDDHLRRELVGGQLVVMPAPDLHHQRMVMRIAAALFVWTREHGGEVFPAPTDVLFTERDVVEPDVVLVRREHADRLGERYIRSAPDLLVEVSSPTTRRVDLGAKRVLYERFGVPEYWFVDLEAERVVAHQLEGVRYGPPRLFGRGETLTSPQVPGLKLEVEDLFAPHD